MRVLVLEDDVDLRRSVVRFLRRGGYAVDESGSLDDADLKLAVNDYDVVVLDRTVPGGDSISLLGGGRIGEDGARCLFLTALDAVDDRVAGLGAGADDYLVKPFAMEELVARVHVLARRVERPLRPLLQVGDVTVDVSRHVASRGGRPLALTAKEFAILRYLANHHERVVSRTELIEHCWDEHADPMSNVVDVKVRLLRQKLGPPPVLHTVRGVGFRLAAVPPAGSEGA